MADTESRDRDLDETRRLLYMALMVRKTKKYNLAGTLVNALRHHQGVTDTGLEDKVVAQVEGTGGPGEAWVYEQIARINDELDGGGA